MSNRERISITCDVSSISQLSSGLGPEQYDEADDESEDRPVNSRTRACVWLVYYAKPYQNGVARPEGHCRDGGHENPMGTRTDDSSQEMK